VDIAAARTFLEIVRTGSFANAAANLNFTQTAIGARVRVLEDELGQQLFIRGKSGVRLSPAGEQFLRFATSFVQLWEQARRSVSMPLGWDRTISVGAELTAYNPLLLRWLHWMRQEHPATAISARVDHADQLVDQVLDGALDMALLYDAPSRPGLVAEVLSEERLVLVRTCGDDRVLGPEDHVGIDWGMDFAAGYQAAFPDRAPPFLTFNYGPVAVDYLLQAGGSAYLRTSVIRPLIEAGRMERVPDAPEFSYSIFAVHSPTADEALIRIIRTGLRAAVA
jgi:DNA-binding transcriptional LysR family regulator